MRNPRSRGDKRFLILTTVALAVSIVLASRAGVSAGLVAAAVLLGAFLLYAFLNAPPRYRRFGPGQSQQAVDNRNGIFGRSYPEERVNDGTSRIGRNERCPCGSGRKFKRCCGT